MKNPYATKAGGPKPGQVVQWQEWVTQEEETRRAALTPEQRQAEDEARRQIGRRMQTESDFR